MPSLADLHEALGRAVAPCGMLHANNHSYAPSAPSALRGLEIDCNVREYRGDPPEDSARVRALQADWDETSRLMNAAWDRYRKHGNVRLYRIETRAIIEREDALRTVEERIDG